MVGFCPGEQPLWACFVTSPCTIPPEARCQADRGINAGGSAKTLDTYVTILLDKNRETVEFEVSGDKIEAIHMIPGWTHNIINLSETENLVTVMTCNEIFDSAHPDTFGEPV